MIAYVKTYFATGRDAVLLVFLLLFSVKGFFFSWHIAGMPFTMMFSPVWLGTPIFATGLFHFGSWSPKHWVTAINIVELPVGRPPYALNRNFSRGHGGDILPWYAQSPGVPRKKDRLLLEIEDWMASNIRGRWRHCNNVFMFSRSQDAIHFKLRWFDVDPADYL